MDSNDISRDAAEAEREEMQASVKTNEASFILIGAFRKLLRKAVLQAIEQKSTHMVRTELFAFERVLTLQKAKETDYTVAQIISDMHGEMIDLIRSDEAWNAQDLFNIESFHAARLKDLLEVEAYILRSQK